MLYVLTGNMYHWTMTRGWGIYMVIVECMSQCTSNCCTSSKPRISLYDHMYACSEKTPILLVVMLHVEKRILSQPRASQFSNQSSDFSYIVWATRRYKMVLMRETWARITFPQNQCSVSIWPYFYWCDINNQLVNQSWLPGGGFDFLVDFFSWS